jgi:sulfide:quinone oxidoreductase
MLKKFMEMFNIKYRTSVAVKEVQKDKVVLSTGEEIQSSFTMLMPPYWGRFCSKFTKVRNSTE